MRNFLIAGALLVFTGFNSGQAFALDQGQDMTQRFEGFRAEVYLCSEGRRTVGYGFNVDDPSVRALVPADVVAGRRGITREEAARVFNVLYARAAREAAAFVGQAAWERLSGQQRDIITDMAYNLGQSRLGGFKRMREAIRSGDYAEAAREMKDSRWYHQTGRRARHHVAAFFAGN